MLNGGNFLTGQKHFRNSFYVKGDFKSAILNAKNSDNDKVLFACVGYFNSFYTNATFSRAS